MIKMPLFVVFSEIHCKYHLFRFSRKINVMQSEIPFMSLASWQGYNCGPDNTDFPLKMSPRASTSYDQNIILSVF